MQATEVMETHVVSVRPDTPVSDVARTLLSHKISAVPVIDKDGNLAGIVSEGDLIRRVETGTERHRSWWLRLLTTNEKLALDYVKSHARHAGEVMTHPVVTASESTTLAEIADLFEKNNIKRVPITKNGKITGIVGRADLLRVLAELHETATPATADDAAIQKEIVRQLNAEPWFSSTLVEISVRDGAVKIDGLVNSHEQREAIVVVAENADGVRTVNDRMRLKMTVGTD
jgi:CBS domain-containing protein